MTAIKIFPYIFLIFISFPFKIYAQNSNDTNISIHSFLQLNDSIKTGKISFCLENQRKSSKTTDQYMFSLIFSKDKNGIKFNLTDSMNQRQYVYNGHVLYTIDHNKKKYGAMITRPRSTIFTLNSFFMDYYIASNVRKHMPKPIENKQVSANNDTINLTGKMTIRWNHLKNSKDSLAAVTDANVEIIFEPETMILKSYRKTLADKESFKKGAILQSEYTLLSAKINDEKYTQPQYYEGLYYARDYKPFSNDNYKYSNKAFYNW